MTIVRWMIVQPSLPWIACPTPVGSPTGVIGCSRLPIIAIRDPRMAEAPPMRNTQPSLVIGDAISVPPLVLTGSL